jgi:hypothetical protein
MVLKQKLAVFTIQLELFEKKYIDLLDTDMSVIPQPILQHHPTRQSIIVRNWVRPIIRFIRKEQNFLSPSHSSLYLVRPQQQKRTKRPLNIVPVI